MAIFRNGGGQVGAAVRAAVGAVVYLLVSDKKYTASDAVQDMRRVFGVGDIAANDRVFIYPEGDQNVQCTDKGLARRILEARDGDTLVLTRSASLVDILRTQVREANANGAPIADVIFLIRTNPELPVQRVALNPDSEGAMALAALLR